MTMTVSAVVGEAHKQTDLCSPLGTTKPAESEAEVKEVETDAAAESGKRSVKVLVAYTAYNCKVRCCMGVVFFLSHTKGWHRHFRGL